MIIDYVTASEYLGRKTDRPLEGRATRLQRRDDATIAVRYQATDVVTYKADGTAVLQSDGWQTPTTKARMKEYTRIQLFQDRSVWYVASDWQTPKAERMVYYDGMVISHDGQPIAPRYPTVSDVQHKRQLDRLVSTYIKGFVADIVANGLSDPGAGDCWGCSMQVVGAEQPKDNGFGRTNRATLHGRVEPMGVDHYLSHMTDEERYYVPSLLWNAIVARGYREPSFIWQMITSRRDGKMASGILRAYFKNLKPALMAARRSA